MPFTIRELTEDDAQVVADLVNQGASEPITVDVARERLRGSRTAGTGREVTRLGAADDAGQVVGYGHALRDGWMTPGLFWLHLAVDPAARGRGVGGQLHEALLGFVCERGGRTLHGEVHDDAPGALRFAEQRGWRIRRHIFESTLDLASFDERPFVAALDRAHAAGIRFTSMAELGDTDAARRRLYEIERVVARDIPGGSESSVRPFEVFVREVCDPRHYLADGQIVAVDTTSGEAHQTWVGLAGVLHYPETNSTYNGITGVLPSHRGQGVATALKLLAIRVAKQHGADSIRTNNDSENAPMLAVNRKLGYRPEPGYYRLIAELG